MLKKQEFELSILEQYQYIVMCLKKLSKIIRVLENTITLSFNDMTNIQLFSKEDIFNIIHHLNAMYPTKAIVHTDSYHLYENLKFTKTQVIMLSKGFVVILSVPITDGNNYHLYSVTPVPTIDNVVMIPSEKYYLQGSTSKWSSSPCVKGTTTYVCPDFNIKTTPCNLTRTTSCEFAHVTNQIQIFQLLNKNNILFFSNQNEIVLQTCENSQNSIQIKGPYVLYSNLSCPMSSMQITLEPKPTNYIKIFPVFNVYKTPVIKHQIELYNHHLDANKLKLDLEPIVPSYNTFKQFNVINIVTFMLIICILCYMSRRSLCNNMQAVWLHLHR